MHNVTSDLFSTQLLLGGFAENVMEQFLKITFQHMFHLII